ncbi:MAG: hypothetical protein VW879_16190, partial [Opitutae bacterium]
MSVNFDADGKASIARNIDFDEDLESHLSFNEDFTEIVLMLYRNGDLYLRYWLGSLDGLPAPSLIPVIDSIDAVSDNDGDGLTDYIEGLVGTSPDLIDTLSQAEIEIAFTYGTTASDEFGSDMEARVAHIIDVSNLALENSGVAARVELTDLIEIGNDSGLTASALISAMGNRTGLFDGLDEKFSRKPD